jgi:uncharacterized protein YaaW (UPF0174 family)
VQFARLYQNEEMNYGDSQKYRKADLVSQVEKRLLSRACHNLRYGAELILVGDA